MTPARERIVVGALAVAAALATAAPTWHAWSVSRLPDHVFTGFRFMAGDHLQYAAFMRQARDEGRLLMENPFTGDRQRPSFVLLFFWAGGRLSRITGLSEPAAWEALRVAGAVLYPFVLWRLAGLFLRTPRDRLAAAALATFAGGISWVASLARAAVTPAAAALEAPFDFYWNWSTIGTLLLPHWTWSVMLVAVCCLLMARGGATGAAGPAILLPLIWFLHPYTGMAAYLAAALLPVVPPLRAALRGEPIPWRRARERLATALPAVSSFAVVAAYLLWARGDPVFRDNSLGGFRWTDSYSVWWYLIGYGLLLPLAWAGLRILSRDESLPADLLLAWLAAALFLSVNPFYAGVKFQYLVFPPLVVLASIGLARVRAARDAPASRGRSGAAVRIASAVGLAAVLFMDAPVYLFREIARTEADPQAFAPAGDLEAMRWLERSPDGLVVSGYWAGNRIPYFAGKKVYQGHWFMTPSLDARRRSVASFFSPQTSVERKRDFLLATGARYVYVGREERSLGSVDPRLPLAKVYDSGGVAIWEVARRPGEAPAAR